MIVADLIDAGVSFVPVGLETEPEVELWTRGHIDGETVAGAEVADSTRAPGAPVEELSSSELL